MNHRIGCCSWSLHPENTAELVLALNRVSLRACQLALGSLARGEAAWADAPMRLRDAGITVVSGMMATVGEDYRTLESIRRTGGIVPDAHWEQNLALARTTAGAAAISDIPLVTFHAGFIPHEPGPDRDVIIRRLRAVADIFADAGIAIALETGQERAETLIAALDELDRDVGVNFDPANMILYGMGDPVESLRALAPRVAQLHIKDAIPTDQPGTWGREVAAGEGGVNWRAFFDVVRTMDVNVDLVIEREAGASREADIAEARDLIQSHLIREEKA